MGRVLTHLALTYMKYFVTGGAGFIGSNYVRGLLNGRWGHDVEQVTVYDVLHMRETSAIWTPLQTILGYRSCPAIFVHPNMYEPLFPAMTSSFILLPNHMWTGPLIQAPYS